MIDELPAAQRPAESLLAPDTNAFIARPDLEAWELGSDPWTIVVLPQVIRELDGLKMRPDEVGKKAIKAIKRFKEYGRRGDTFNGVPIAGKLSLREIAVDANMALSPSWLRAEHADDQFLAGALELKWRYLTSSVLIVTGDRNLQNKARFAHASYIDTDEL
jgi:predicted ribonuclease YlaK